jgi:hypothetical protein
VVDGAGKQRPHFFRELLRFDDAEGARIITSILRAFAGNVGATAV